MKFISLFAGIGGFDLGLERAGMQCVAQVEIDPFCQKVLTKHWPNVERFSDVRECGKHNLPTADLICGGFPCQPHSLAGKRRGAKDDRDLWPEYRRIIAECRPRWVIGENVPGIRTTILDQVLSDLDDLGYTTGAIVIPACAFDAPHRRERVFVVAHADRFQQGRGEQPERGQEERDTDSSGHGAGGGVGYVADAASVSRGLSEQSRQNCTEVIGSGEIISDAKEQRRNRRPGIPQAAGEDGRISTERNGTWWAIEPPVGRVAHGIPGRVDRLKSLGNAVVPQVVEWIGRNILAVEMTTTPPTARRCARCPCPHARKSARCIFAAAVGEW